MRFTQIWFQGVTRVLVNSYTLNGAYVYLFDINIFIISDIHQLLNTYLTTFRYLHTMHDSDSEAYAFVENDLQLCQKRGKRIKRYSFI